MPLLMQAISIPVLVGNNRVYEGGGVSYYLPGNSPAQPPSHREWGTTAQGEDEQAI